MIRNYLKVAWRHLLQNKGLSFINIFGLAIGMAFAILIGLWIQFEISYDKFHVNGDRIAMVMKHSLFNNTKGTQSSTPLPLYYEFKSKYPEVKYATRMDWGNQVSLMVGDKKFSKTGQYVDPDFLQMFSFPVIKGDSRTALNDIHSIVITESLAATLFGNDDPMGKTVRMNNELDLKVAAVMKDVPKNSSIQFDYLGPYEYIMSTNEFYRNQKTNWGNNFLMNVVQLKDGVSMDEFSNKIKMRNVEGDKSLKDLFLFLQPLKNWHLKNEFKNWVQTGGQYEYVKLFGIIGIFVLLIACINFMNLSTARSEKRAREVGIRKAIGSLRSQLIVQFLTETLLTSLIAFLLAIVVIIPLSLPLLKDLGFQNVRFDPGNASLLFVILGVAILTGLIAGSYPALYLSSFLPVKVLKGLFKQGQGAVTFRRVLVVSQFAISIGLIISTVIVFQQIEHARGRSIGYDPNNLLRIPASSDVVKNFIPLKSDLMNTGYVESIAKASGPLTAIWNSWSDFEWEGKNNDQIAIDVIMSEWDFEKTARMKFVQGRPFSRDFKTDSNAIILNQSALRMIGYKDPIGKTMKSGGQVKTIIGIVEDMLVTDPYKAISPTVLMFNANSTNFVYVRLKDNASLSKGIDAIQTIFEKYNPSFPFEFKFSDQEFEQKFNVERQVAKLAGIFAMLAVFISCLGLFGLAAFMAERRTKEIGIRKVLGASLLNLWTLLSKEFVWLVIGGCVIASPVVYFLMHNWLQSYDYRINIHWWVFAIAGIVSLIIALLTVSTQAIKAAVANPVKSLRTE